MAVVRVPIGIQKNSHARTHIYPQEKEEEEEEVGSVTWVTSTHFNYRRTVWKAMAFSIKAYIQAL